jgi:hypothetical protein
MGVSDPKALELAKGFTQAQRKKEAEKEAEKEAGGGREGHIGLPMLSGDYGSVGGTAWKNPVGGPSAKATWAPREWR